MRQADRINKKHLNHIMHQIQGQQGQQRTGDACLFQRLFPIPAHLTEQRNQSGRRESNQRQRAGQTGRHQTVDKHIVIMFHTAPMIFHTLGRADIAVTENRLFQKPFPSHLPQNRTAGHRIGRLQFLIAPQTVLAKDRIVL